jgi:ABC-type sulfate transport system permease component
MNTETAQRILWFAMIFIMLMAAAFAVGGVLIGLAFAYVDVASFITDPTILAFIGDYPWAIPYALAGLALIQAIFLLVIFSWRKDPMAHRTGFTIIGILMLIAGWSLPGFLIILPGLLLEGQ